MSPEIELEKQRIYPRWEQKGPKPNLDLFRTVAVIFVVADHLMLTLGIAKPGPRSLAWIGVLGVYMFFVHTCLVLMWSLDRKPHPLDFYIRRAFRIYPLAIFAVFCAVLVHLREMPSFVSSPRPSVSTIVANCLLLQNIVIRKDIIGPFWSLPLEVDMYVALPFLYFFVRKNMTLWPLFLLSGLTLGLSHEIWWWQGANTFASVIPCFLMGIVAYVLFERVSPRCPAWTFPIFLAIVTIFYMWHPGVPASYPTCLILGLGLPFFEQIRSRVLVRASHEIAKYSYGIYLSHMFGLTLAFYGLRGHSLALQAAVFLLSVAAFSVAGYHLLEKPMIDFGARVAARAERRYEAKLKEEGVPVPAD